MYSYTINKNGGNHGPLTIEQVRAGLADGTFAGTDLAWRPGLADWVPLDQRLLQDSGEAPPTLPGATVIPDKKPFNWLIPAILSTVFSILFCWVMPLGITAIVFAAKANSKEKSGDAVGAAKSRGLAMGFTIATASISILVIPLLAALAIPAFRKVRNSAVEKMMINDARQISAAANQVMSEESSATAGVGKIRRVVPALSSGETLVIDGHDISFISGGADKVVLSQSGKFSLRNEVYSRKLAMRPEIQNQTGPDDEIEFSVETGKPVE